MTPEELEAVQRLVDLAAEQMETRPCPPICFCWTCRWQREITRARIVIPELQP
jgi:hypothetical protein